MRGHQLGGNLVARRAVHLVHDDDGSGPVLALGVLEQRADDVAVAGPDGLARLDDRHDHVDAVGGGARGLIEPSPEGRLRPVDARGVHKDDLDAVLGQYAPDGLARRVRARRSDRDLRADDLIQQC